MKKILFLLLLVPLILLPVTFAQQKPTSNCPCLWFVSWIGTPTDSATGNITYTFQGFMWADSQFSNIEVRALWGDGSSNDYASSGTLNPMYSSPTYTGFMNGPSHIYTTKGTFVFYVTILDQNNNFAQNSVTILVSQGPNLSGVYGAGGRAPISL